MKKLWFRRKRFGWGWTPASWEGWLVTAIFVGTIFLDAQRFDLISNPDKKAKPLEFAVETVILLIIFLGICYKKGEKLNW